MSWKWIKVFIALAGGVPLVVGFLLFAGQGYKPVTDWLTQNPRMIVQPHLRTYDAQMPPMPAGATPVQPTQFATPTTQQAEDIFGAGKTLPTDSLVRAGQVYYGYYCLSCHGVSGDGHGPVGESYVPTPSDLRTPKVQAMSEAELLRAMLTGDGHEPVLGKTVLPEHRVALVAYIRQLAAATQPAR